MHLSAAFVPPASVTTALTAIVSVPAAGPVAMPEPQRRGLFGRRSGTEATTATTDPLLDVLATHQMLVPITDLGYVASGDAGRVARALEDLAADLSAPTVRVSGGDALSDPEDRSVWALVAGEEDELTALRGLAQGVVSAIEPLGFFRDRRQYKPRLPLATINDHTSAEGLEAVLAALAAYDGGPWQVDRVTLLQRSSQGSEVWREIPVGG